MSRFSPNSLLDAVTFPFAMVQYRANVYVEAIAPDVRPATFLLLLMCLIVVASLRRFRKRADGQARSIDGLRTEGGTTANRRMAVAVVVATGLALVLWIASSANGRYGLLPITLCAPAIVACAVLLLQSRRAQIVLVGVALAAQTLFLVTGNPDHTWTQLTPDIWSEPNALGYQRNATNVESIESEKDVVVISPRSQTAMSAAWQLFGPRPTYINAAYLVDNYPYGSDPMRRALDAVKKARVIYSVFASPAVVNPLTKNAGEVGNSSAQLGKSSRISFGDRARLRVLGAALDESKGCVIMPPRLGAHLVVCSLLPTAPSRVALTDLPAYPLALADRLARACPRLFGEMMNPGTDGDGGIELPVHDGKYYLVVTKAGKIYAKPRNDWNYRLVVDAKGIDESAGSFKAVRDADLRRHCVRFAPPGTQYFR